MKKILIASVLASLLLPVAALAASETNPPAGNLDFFTVVNNLKTAAWEIFAVVALIMFVVAGIEFVTAQGDPEKLQKARSFFLWGVVGVAVAVLAYSILAIVGTLMRQ